MQLQALQQQMEDDRARSEMKLQRMQQVLDVAKQSRAVVGVDLDGDGIADTHVSGVDMDGDGIPDRLQVCQPLYSFAGHDVCFVS